TASNGEVDDILLKSVTHIHPVQSNLHIIGGLDDKTLFHKITPEFVTSLVNSLRLKYRHIILDLGSSLYSVPNIIGLQNSDLVINIVDRDITSFIYGWRSAK